MSVSGAYRRHAAALRRLVMQALREEAPYPELRRRIRRYLSKEGLGEDLAEELASEAEGQYEWIDRRFMQRGERRRAAEVLEGAGEGFARMEGALDERLKKVVLRALQENAPLGEIENRIARALSSGRHQAFTVANTARAGFSRATRFRSVAQIEEGTGEEQYLKYTGPPPDRAFCKKHIGRVYTRREIERLSNGQGLPVAYFCGGYNCRHQWVLASRAEAERRMEDAALRPRMAALGAGPAASTPGATPGAGGESGGGGRGGGRGSKLASVLAEARRDFEALAMDEHVPEAASEALTREELLTVFEWTRDQDVSKTFREVNSALYGGQPQTPFTRAFAANLNRALAKLPVLGQRVVFRGSSTGRIPNLAAYQEGKRVRFDGFTATSKEAQAAFSRQGVDVQMTIIQRSARDLEPLSANGSIRAEPRNEHEALVPSARFFEVLYRRDRPDGIIDLILEELSDGR